MSNYLQQVSIAARQAVRAKNWPQVKACARDIVNRDRESSEGFFLLGLAEKAAHRKQQAIRAFSTAITLDSDRYDAVVELAGLYLQSSRHGDAVALLKQYETRLSNSPLYLDRAATIYTDAGQAEQGWPLYRRADELQPDVDSLRARFAACSVYVGKIDQAEKIYEQLLEKNPNHQRNHYELSKLKRAADKTHIDQMMAMLLSTKLRPEKNIYAYYALGKEFEDLELWDEAFEYYKMAGDAAVSVAGYDVNHDVKLIDKIIEVCDEDWLARAPNEDVVGADDKTPIFVVGLPRTGTTLTERILSSHSQVESVGESHFVQDIIKSESRIKSDESMSSAIIESTSKKDILPIRNDYLEAIAYRFGEKPMFVEKFPENFLYLGFLVKAFPHCRIVYLNRNPMDACFAMFKQSFFRYAYSLDDLAAYYVAYHRLHEHWREVLGDRLIEFSYEDLVSNPEPQIRRLLSDVGLDFEDACLDFEKNSAASNTASTVQIREKIHARSLNRWAYFGDHLHKLKTHLASAGIKVV